MNHARIESGRVRGIFLPQFYADGPHAGEEIPLADLYHPDFVATLVECPDEVQDGWFYNGSSFTAPPVPPAPTIADLILLAKAETRIQRQPIITVCDGLQASALAKGDLALATVIETAKQGLRDITELVLYDCTTYEQMKAKTLARYAQIASASPVLKAAFKEALT